MRRSDHPGFLLTQAVLGLRPSGALKRVQFFSQKNCVSAKVAKAISPRKASPAYAGPSRSRSASGGAHTVAAGSRGDSSFGDGGIAPKATLFIPAACAHCRRSVRLGHWALRPCAGCARARSLTHPFRLDFGLSSTRARRRGGKTKPRRCWGPRGRRPSIVAGSGGVASPVFEPEARCSAPGELGERRCRRDAQGGVGGFRGVVLFGDFLLDTQEKVTCRGSATRK